jgi:hypothetical protein
MKKNKPSNNRKTKAKTSTSKPYWEMTTAELREATKEFDHEFVGDTFRPSTPEEQARFERARKRGRPPIGAGSKTISVTVETRLLAKTDRLAKKLQVPRAALIARGLQAVVSEEVTM